MLHAAAHGKGGVATVSGPVASGKTELMHLFAEHATDSGALLLTATASRAEQSLPFGVMAQLFQPVAQSPEGQQWTGDLMSSESCGKATSLEKSYAQVVQALWMILTDLTASRPVALMVDDVQHADESSIHCLLYLARRLRFTRALMVLNEQTGLPHQFQAFHTELLRQPHCRRIKFGPLTQDGVRELLSSRLGEQTAVRLAPLVSEVTGGNPLLVNGVIEDHQSGVDTGADEVVLGDAFGEAVLACLHRSSSQSLEVSKVIAVLGGSGCTEFISSVLGSPMAATSQYIRMLNVIGVLSGWQFRHPAGAQAVLDQIPVDERARIHVRAATVLRETGGSKEAVAQHLLAAGAPLPAWASSVLRDAAEMALFGDQTHTAIAYLELACSICTDEQERGALMALLTSIEWRVDPSGATRHLSRLSSTDQLGQLDRQHATTMLRYLLWHGLFDEAEETMRHLATLPTQDDPAGAAEVGFLRMWLTYSYPPLAAHLPLPATGADQVVTAALTTSTQHQAATVLSTILANQVDDHVVGRAEQLLQSCQLDDATLEPLTTVLTALMYADRTQLAAHWCDALLGEASARRAPTWQAVLSSTRAEISLRQGDLLAAQEHARAALTRVSPERWGPSIGSPLASQLLAATEMGDFDEAARVLARPAPQSMYESRFGLYYLHARGRYYLATGRPHAALHDFQMCRDLMTVWRIDLPGLVPWRLDLAETHLHLKNRNQAVALVEEQLAVIPATPSRTRGMALRLLALAGDISVRQQLLLEASDVLHASDARLELAKALTDLSHVHHVTGESDRARMVSRRATSVARSCHAEPLLERTSLRSPERQPVIRPEVIEIAGSVDVSALSEAERRVAALAAQGHTNRQIARRLFITVSTVEQHLTRAYRKLNVNRRTDLPTRLESMTVDSA